MKNLFSLFTVLVITSAHAAPLFMGKFTVDSANCNDPHFNEATRVYIGRGLDSGVPTLEIHGYGSDATLQIILLGRGSRRLPGIQAATAADELIETWDTRIKAPVLLSRTVTVRSSTHYRTETRTRLEDLGTSLWLENSDPTRNGFPAPALLRCHLLR